jgi:hypothetical protein
MYWCFHCGREGDTPAEIVHADDCRSQTNIWLGTEETVKRECKWCDACGAKFPIDWNYCPWCTRELKTIYC